MIVRHKSDAMASVHEAIADLHGHGMVNKATMRHFDKLCLVGVPAYSAEEIRALRERLNISQNVLACCRLSSASQKPDMANLCNVPEEPVVAKGLA